LLREQAKKQRVLKEKSPEKPPVDSDLPCHEDLFASLKEMRLKLARASNLLPCHLPRPDTQGISQELPQTTSELLAIKGCGDYKVSTYGTRRLKWSGFI